VHAAVLGLRFGSCVGMCIGESPIVRKNGWMDRGKEGDKTEKNAGDVQVVTQYPRTKNAHGEEVTTQITIATKNASDCLVAVFFCVCRWGTGSVIDAKDGETEFVIPFLATMFHAVGLNVMDPSERKRDVLDASTRALRDMIAMSWLRTTEPLHVCMAEILRTSCLRYPDMNSDAYCNWASLGSSHIHPERSTAESPRV